MPSPVVSRPSKMTNKMEACRIILQRDPEIGWEELRAALQKEFKMWMSDKQTKNYRRDILEKLKHPARPVRTSSNGAGQEARPASTAPADSTQLDELMRIGNEIGWEEVLKTAQIAVKVRK